MDDFVLVGSGGILFNHVQCDLDLHLIRFIEVGQLDFCRSHAEGIKPEHFVSILRKIGERSRRVKGARQNGSFEWHLVTR